MQVLLVHGLGRTPLSLFGLAAALRRAGHHTRFFAYSSTFESVPHIVDRLARRLRGIARLNRPLGLVGHSLGGLLLRLALDRAPGLAVHQLVMLGTPNRGSRVARMAMKWAFFRLFARDCGRLLAASHEVGIYSQLGVPYTSIAGTGGPRGKWSPFGDLPNDGLVSVDETAIGATEAAQMPVIHTVMMDSPRVRSRILAEFEESA